MFTTVAGTPLDPNNVRRRMLKLLAEEAGASWAGFHTLSHAFAHRSSSRLESTWCSSAGHSAITRQLHAGHYVHLLDGEAAPALDLAAQLYGANNGATHATETGRTPS